MAKTETSENVNKFGIAYNGPEITSEYREQILDSSLFTDDNSTEFAGHKYRKLADVLQDISALTKGGIPSNTKDHGDGNRGRILAQMTTQKLKEHDFDYPKGKNIGSQFLGIYQYRVPGTPQAEAVEQQGDHIGVYQDPQSRQWMVSEQWWMEGAPELEAGGDSEIPGGLWFYRQTLPKGTRRGRPAKASKGLSLVNPDQFNPLTHEADVIDYFRQNPEELDSFMERVQEGIAADSADELAETAAPSKSKGGNSKRKSRKS